MRRAIACASATILLALSACDPEGGDDDETVFRAITYVQVQTQTASFKAQGCDPPIEVLAPQGGEVDEKEWMAMIHHQGRMMGDELLVRTFLAQPGSAKLCEAACAEVDGKWTGEARTLKAAHKFGETEITDECPFGTVATSTPTQSKGDIGCACAG